MRKWSAILGLLLATMPPMPGEATQAPAQSPDSSNHHSQGNQSTPGKSPTLIDAKKQAITPGNGHEEPASDDKEHSVKLTSLPPVTLTDKRKTFWDYFFDWGPWSFGLITAIAAGLQIWLLFRTWKSIERQADLQKFITKQWVDVGDWSIGGDDAWDREWEVNREERSAKEKSRELKSIMSMGVSFHVFNRTLYPLSIKRVVIFVGKWKQNKWAWKTFHDSGSLVLPPSSPTGENAEVYTVPFQLAGDEVFRYTRSGFYLRVHVRIIYLGPEGEAIRQDFPMDITFKENAKPVFDRYSDRRVKEVTEAEQSESETPN